MPADVFAGLASGGGGESAIQLLAAAQRSKRILLVRAVLDHVGAAGDRAARDLVRAYELLATLQATSPTAAVAVERVMAYPSVAAWAVATLRALVRPDRPERQIPDPGYLAAVAAAAAVHAGVEARVTVPVLGGLVTLPSLGTARMGSADTHGAATVRSWPGGAVIDTVDTRAEIPRGPGPHRGGTAWTGLRRLDTSAAGLGLSVVLDDIDPFSFPGRESVHQVTTAETATWHRTLTAAWSLLARHQHTVASEIAGTVSVLVPLAASHGRHTSATSRDAFGAVALSEPVDGRSLAATLAHEVQHAKLGALLDLVPLFGATGDTRWYAPWRDDPRPLGSLLQGTYAHLGVAGFWRTQRWLEDAPEAALHAHTEFARYRDQTLEAVETLRTSGALTAAGRHFVDGMAATLTAWRREPVPAQAAARARAQTGLHRHAWRLRHAISDMSEDT